MTVAIYLRLVALIALVVIIVTLLRAPRHAEANSGADAVRKLAPAATLSSEQAFTPPEPRADESGAGAIAGESAVPVKAPRPVGNGTGASESSSKLHDGVVPAPQRADSAGDEPKPIPVLPRLQQVLENAQHPVPQAALQRLREMQYESEDAWSQDTEARLRKYAAAQPQAGGVEALITCRATQCLIQMSDVQKIEEKGTRYDSPSQALFYGMQFQPWFLQLLQHVDSQVVMIESRPHFIGFFERVP